MLLGGLLVATLALSSGGSGAWFAGAIAAFAIVMGVMLGRYSGHHGRERAHSPRRWRPTPFD